jgi:transcriptional regulator with XRE-family HTH domain
MSTELFGKLLRSLRQRTGKTMRDFCLENNFDPGNYSRLERGIFPPPQREERLAKYATALGIKRGSDDWIVFFDTAAACRGQIPRDLLADHDLVKKLPVVFRSLRWSPVSPRKLDDLIDKIRKA